MSFKPCHIRYELTRRPRLLGHLGVWAPYLPGLTVLMSGSFIVVVALALWVSSWLSILVALPLWIARSFLVGVANVIFIGVQSMDVILEENGLGYATKSDRFWIFLDGVIQLHKYSEDTWTIFHFNGTVVHIPSSAIEDRYIEHIHRMMEWGKTREGIQAVVHRGQYIHRLEAEDVRKRGESQR